MIRINNFSGGLCSFWSAFRDVQEAGPENVILLFADTRLGGLGMRWRGRIAKSIVDTIAVL